MVGIYDAGIHRDQVFIVMEFVEGRTLAEWLHESSHSVHEILAMFRQAGRGLAAAHAVGLVHRDFKPANVLVGTDGVARVTDFGLAREPSVSASTGPTSDGPRQRCPPTGASTTEGLAGTPAYMAPEQREGRATEKSDQFSFSVALLEALGDASPLWVRTKLARGTRPDPEERYPSMETLLLALSRDPRQTAWRWGRWAIAVIVAAATIGLFARAELRERRICSGAEDKLAGVWDDSRRDAVKTAFLGTSLPYAEETWQRTKATLDTYAASWAAMHTDACKATQVRKEQSQEVLDLRMACLGERLRDLRATTDLFTRADVATVEKAVMIGQSLRRIDGCADAAALRSGVSAPLDPNVRAKMETVATSLAQVRVLEQAGKLADASDVVGHAVDEARATQYPPLFAEATAPRHRRTGSG